MRMLITCIAFALAAVFFLAQCSAPDRKGEHAGQIRVLSTTAMIDDVVAKVGGERVEHSALIIGEMDPHSYELVKGDDEKIIDADIVFYNGLNLEHGASLHAKLQKHPFSLAVGDDVLQRHPEVVLHVNGEMDPHLWMDISAWQYVIDPILQSLVQADPEGELYYRERAQECRKEMLSVHAQIVQELQNIPEEKRFLVTSHDAFGYFARSYLATPDEQITGEWKKRLAAPEGLAPDGQLSTMDIQAIIDFLLFHHVQVVFPESNVSKDSLKKIVFACREKKREIKFSAQVLYGDAMGAKNSDAGTYLDMIQHNAKTLVQEWQ